MKTKIKKKVSVKNGSSWVDKVKNKQKQCLRKRKRPLGSVFCFIRVLVTLHPYRVLLGLLMACIISSLIIVNGFGSVPMTSVLQTSLVSQLSENIGSKQAAIARRQACISTPWIPEEKNICKGTIYDKTSPQCVGLGGPSRIETVGQGVCCNDYESNKMKACLGADIFLENIPKNSWQDVSLVATEADCYWGVKCQFYPDPTKYHAKINESTGEYFKDDDGNIIIEKNCTPKVTTSDCDKDCGGGSKTILTRLANCTHVKTLEYCNLQPCFTEIVN